MTADVQKLPSGLFRAWCEDHQDGIQARTKKTSQRWAERHNTNDHQEEA